MNRFFKVSSYFLLAFNILLLFILAFENKVTLPVWMNPIGRMHPLLLHLPIGFSVILVLVLLLKKEFEAKSYATIIKLILVVTALSAAISALMGFFLSREGGYNEELLQQHKWTGIGVSLVTYLIVWVNDNWAERTKAFTYLSIGSLGLIMLAGHLGAAITHGENYLFEAFQKKKEAPLFSENNTVYEAAIFPILENKCLSCHNEQKVKGQLDMSSIAKLLKGGKNGPIWKAGDALNSHLIERANLPLEEKKHMPPKGKPQLTVEEIALLTNWINEGADVKRTFKTYAANSKTKESALKLVSFKAPIKEAKVYRFSEASASNLEAVNTPYCSVSPLSSDSPALQADFFVSKKFERKTLENLSKVGEQLVVLNLAKMPVKDEDISLIANFTNLEKLILNQTEITGSTLEQLKKCKNLSSVALAGTKITKDKLSKLIELPALKEIFVWNTSVDEVAVKEFSKKYPKIVIDAGGEEDPNEVLTLNPPILVNEEFVIKGNTPIQLKHPLRNVKIHYTLDGTDPDSTTATIYDKPILINGFTMIKALATKDHWYASKKIEYSFFKSAFSPDSAYLATTPNQRYMGRGGKTLIDLKKGAPDNHQEPTWVGFKESDFVGLFEFKNPTPLKNVTISYLLRTDSYLMPPTVVEVWGGNNHADLKLLQKISPKQPEKKEKTTNVGLEVPVPANTYKMIKIVAKPLKKLPKWHKGKGEPAWFFVDEILFN